jgi:hypothetical protein
MRAQPNKSYRIYGKTKGMKRFAPLNHDTFTANLIHAPIYSPENGAEAAALDRELVFLNTQGAFELREVKKQHP